MCDEEQHQKAAGKVRKIRNSGSLYLSVTPKFYTEVLHQTTSLTPN